MQDQWQELVHRCGKGALIAISRLGSTFCVKPLLGAIQSVPSIFEGTWSAIKMQNVRHDTFL